MKIGTKSILFGAHQFLIHPLFVAFSWWRLYGFPFDLRLWMAFFLHDMGYWGKPNMDGKEGEQHPFWAANILYSLFGESWYWFCVCHSRFLADAYNKPPSKLCYADKLAMCFEPWWLYLPRVILTGEIREYMALAKTKYKEMNSYTESKIGWKKNVCEYINKWVEDNK